VNIAEEYLTESMLISAYDIYHNHVGLPTSALTNIVLVDSGGYETSDLHDLSATYHQAVSAMDWDEEKLCSVLDAWPAFAPAMFVSLDHASPRYHSVSSLSEHVG
jgi:hypothetical protein